MEQQFRKFKLCGELETYIKYGEWYNLGARFKYKSLWKAMNLYDNDDDNDDDDDDENSARTFRPL